MTYKINFYKEAQNDISDTFKYIAETLGNPAAAKRLCDRVVRAAESLCENPERYPIVKHKRLSKQGLRSLPVANYLLFYVVNKKNRSVYIMHLTHSRRNWQNLFKEIDTEETT